MGFNVDCNKLFKLTVSLPQLYSLRINNIRQKLEFYESIGLREICIKDAKQLMQSVDLSYARYRYLEDRGVTITRKNYRLLFKGIKYFEKQFGITKSQLLELYKYEEEKERRK